MIGKVFIGGVLVVFASVVSLTALKYFAFPYLWMALAWAGVLLCALVLAPRVRALWISLTIAVCAFAALEGSFSISQRWVFKDVRSEGTFTWVSHDVLGFVAAKGTAQREAKFYRGEKLYDVVYTMDANGLRVSSPNPQSARLNQPCVLFFGDSYTFGWGLNDQETLPYRVAERSNSRYRVYNLAFPTHGAHQMLAALERGLASKLVDCTPQNIKYVIYVATADHVRRAAGLREIDHLHGPRYALGADGTVSYQGQFGEDYSRADKLRSLLAKSSLYRQLAGGDAIYMRAYSDADVALYLAIVNTAAARIKNLYPDAKFHVIMWGNDFLERNTVLPIRILGGLKDRGLVVHRVNDILPGADEQRADYFFGGFSPHPNAAANDRIAEYIVREILR
jgi:hypothetical protein